MEKAFIPGKRNLSVVHAGYRNIFRRLEHHVSIFLMLSRGF